MQEDNLQEKLQSAVDKILDKIDQEKIQSAQKKSFIKMAECFDASSGVAPSRRNIDKCLDNQQRPVQKIMEIVNSEISEWQKRLQRCSQSCKDNVETDYYQRDTKSVGVQESMQKEFNKCNMQCADKHIDLLKSIKQKIESDISRIQDNQKYLE